MRVSTIHSLLLVLASLAVLSVPSGVGAEARSRVFINGSPVPVYFNDGDSFRIFGGPYAGRAARLGGYNTLESYGPVHYWGNWHPYELYVVAKQATLLARRGTWHCTTAGEADTYGRLLLDCPDLATRLIRQGLAHHMQVDDTPTRPEYMRAQQEAIRARRGMWAHGVPGFVLTSLHSATEDPSRDSHYNRMVSTRDGHSEKWEHNDTYVECQAVCASELRADEERVRAYARRLREDTPMGTMIADLPNLLLIEIVDRYARLEQLPEWVEDPALRDALGGRLAHARSSGLLGEVERVRSSCNVYVDFRRRFGVDRATCLRGHGIDPRGQLR